MEDRCSVLRREAFGRESTGELSVQTIATCRNSLPEARRYPAHRALRQVLQAAVRWKWIEENADVVSGRC
jgi:hypothetical protein